MPFGASLIPFLSLVEEGELILFGPWSPQTWRHQTQLWKGSKEESMEIYILKSETSKSPLHHQPPQGFQNMKGRLKSISRRLRISLWGNGSNIEKKKKNNEGRDIGIQEPPLDRVVVKPTGQQGAGILSSFLGEELLATELRRLALSLSWQFLKPLDGLLQILSV